MVHLCEIIIHMLMMMMMMSSCGRMIGNYKRMEEYRMKISVSRRSRNLLCFIEPNIIFLLLRGGGISDIDHKPKQTIFCEKRHNSKQSQHQSLTFANCNLKRRSKANYTITQVSQRIRQSRFIRP